jgi:hypothetical protein
MHCTELYPSNFILFRILLSQDFVSRGQSYCVWVHVLMRLIKWFLSKICYCPFVLLIIKGREASHLRDVLWSIKALFPFSTQIIPKRLEQVGAITSSLCRKALDGMLFYVYFMNSILIRVVSFFFIIMNSKDLPKVNLVWLLWLNWSKETIFSSHDNGTFIEPNCLCL